jgi:hypothetical protein
VRRRQKSDLTYCCTSVQTTSKSCEAQALPLPIGSQLLQLTRLDLSHLRVQSGSQQALQRVCQLSALQSLQLGWSNLLSSSVRYLQKLVHDYSGAAFSAKAAYDTYAASPGRSQSGNCDHSLCLALT